MSRLVRVFVQRRAGIRARLLLTLVLCGLSADLLAGGAIGTSEKSDQVDQLLSVFTTGIQPGAAVMVIRNGIVVHSKGYGYADLDKAILITPAACRIIMMSLMYPHGWRRAGILDLHRGERVPAHWYGWLGDP